MKTYILKKLLPTLLLSIIYLISISEVKGMNRGGVSIYEPSLFEHTTQFLIKAYNSPYAAQLKQQQPMGNFQEIINSMQTITEELISKIEKEIYELELKLNNNIKKTSIECSKILILYDYLNNILLSFLKTFSVNLSIGITALDTQKENLEKSFHEKFFQQIINIPPNVSHLMKKLYDEYHKFISNQTPSETISEKPSNSSSPAIPIPRRPKYIPSQFDNDYFDSDDDKKEEYEKDKPDDDDDDDWRFY